MIVRPLVAEPSRQGGYSIEIICKETNRDHILLHQGMQQAAQRFAACPGVVCRGTRWWAGRDNAGLTKPASSHTNCLKTRRLPPVGCIIPVLFRDAVLGGY